MGINPKQSYPLNLQIQLQITKPEYFLWFKVALKTEDVDPAISEHVSALLSELGPGNPEDDDESSDDDKENACNDVNSCGSSFEESEEDDIPMEV